MKKNKKNRKKNTMQGEIDLLTKMARERGLDESQNVLLMVNPEDIEVECKIIKKPVMNENDTSSDEMIAKILSEEKSTPRFKQKEQKEQKEQSFSPFSFFSSFFKGLNGF